VICASPHLWENDHLIDAVRARLRHEINDVFAVSQTEAAGHGGDGLVLVTFIVHKEGEDEVGGRQDGLTDGRSHSLAASVSTGARGQVLCFLRVE
jgi:hypothetical protein